ncbi:hypothetical protein A5320_01630 [Rheinheimera sp. SA_1]|jgi:predicted Fe-S protein YdhL (DUF1289 family)|uniref:DUF1289 domain-containing protein n=1 Tax=Rheinheimera sp. SA_1 TaxID=1827365 RepID=UPI000800ED78|nr:DUF1289 domain-containing protein [Rheinheimera sp. SA_1]OBP16148.1 hypothetical protein A5320_01630 [Rheinheimera sp. SA_1]
MDKAPCQRNCCLDQDDICLGCGRSLTEICGWHQADAAQKQQILAQAEQRLTAKKRPADVLTSAQAVDQASRGKPS